ncbi:cysteine hydrolase family protein [Pontibacter toksunensis]|uniref:Cysteine hydrolase family protein n=1 Tax=Pontibacter toksunensis TaxID=1332631 RepID=A0ABW6C389_9BACT
MKKAALLVIDMQVGALQLSNPRFHALDGVIERLEKLIGRGRDKGVLICYAQHHNPDGFPTYGSSEWEIIPQIGPESQDIVVQKTTPDVFLNTALHEQLQEKNIGKLIIAGIQTADCIDTSCRRAFSLGYEVVLVKDGHTTFDSQNLRAEQIIAHHNQIMANWFGQVIESEKVVF